MDIINQPLFQFFVELILFLVLTAIGTFIYKKIINSDNKYLNPEEFLPQDEIHTLKQVLYLIMMALCFANLLYSFIFVSTDYFYLTLFDIALSLAIAITIDKSTLKNKVLYILLVPFGSLSYIFFGYTLVGLIDLIHIPIFLYFVKYYYDRFNYYTKSHGLSITIILLFSIILFSFFLTQLTEGKDALDSLVMVSNAFTSNGYAVLGNSIPGKINSLFLVWGGYIISGVATSTLTAAILIKHFNRRVEELERIIEEGSDE